VDTRNFDNILRLSFGLRWIFETEEINIKKLYRVVVNLKLFLYMLWGHRRGVEV
jgi:hypothetical protein